MSVATVVLTLLLAQADALPSTAAEQVAYGVQRYGELDYRGAALAFKAALDSDSISEDDRLKALAYLARTQAVLDRHRLAVRTFVRVLRRDSSFSVSWEESPRIQKAFGTAKKVFAEEQKAASAATTPGRGPRRGHGGADRGTADPDKTVVSATPVDEDGDGDASDGSDFGDPGITEVAPSEPFWAAVPEWVWWTAGAVVVAGIGATVIVLSVDGGDETPAGAPKWHLP